MWLKLSIETNINYIVFCLASDLQGRGILLAHSSARENTKAPAQYVKMHQHVCQKGINIPRSDREQKKKQRIHVSKNPRLSIVHFKFQVYHAQEEIQLPSTSKLWELQVCGTVIRLMLYFLLMKRFYWYTIIMWEKMGHLQHLPWFQIS